MKGKSKNNKGITLIALVITIIVLLILAGVAISMLVGDNGILRQAAEAKTKTDQAAAEEAIKLALLAARTNENGIFNSTTFEQELDKAKLNWEKDETTGEYTIEKDGEKYTVSTNGKYEKVKTIAELKTSGEAVTKNTTLTDTSSNSITIPANFKISSESPTLVTEGMIIEDSQANQYVWIPVEANFDDVKSKTEDTEEYYTAIETALKNYTATYKSSSYTEVWYGDASYGKYGYYDGSKFVYYTNGNMTEEEYNTLYHDMLKSVYKNKGFYIGRYEMGIGVANDTSEAQDLARTSMSEYTASKATNTSTTVVANGAPSIEGMVTPISKANAVPYNYITQSQAQMLAKKLGEGSEYSNVESSIMFGVQWDAVCVFIEKYDKNNTATTKSQWLTSNTYSKLWGNYYNSTFTMDQGFYTTTYSSNPVTWNNKPTTAKGTSSSWLCTTGASDKNSSLNIYDFGGNEMEWALSRVNASDHPCSALGSYFGYSYYVCAGYGYGYTYAASSGISSRISLFM